MKKKALSLILAGAMALSMSACGGNGGETTAAPTEKATSAPTEESGKEEAGEESKEESTQAQEASEGGSYTVGICQLVQHAALDAATQGFKDALTEELGDAVTFDEQNAQGDSNTCSTIINSFVSSDVDLILANATPALQAAQAGTNEIPSIMQPSPPRT